MKVFKGLVFFVMISFVSICCMTNITYAENEKPATFEEALEQSEKLREYYEWADPIEQKQLRDDWQAVHDRWKTMSEEEKTEINDRREVRRQKWERMSPEELGKLEKIRKRFST